MDVNMQDMISDGRLLTVDRLSGYKVCSGRRNCSILWSAAIMERSLSSYAAIAKGCGFLYACDNQIYKQVKQKEQ